MPRPKQKALRAKRKAVEAGGMAGSVVAYFLGSGGLWGFLWGAGLWGVLG